MAISSARLSAARSTGSADAGAAGSGGGAPAARCGVDGNRPNPAATHRVYRGVVGDAENPGGQASADVECRESADGLDERLLGEILRERPVAGEADEQRQDRPLVTTDNLLVGRLRARERLSDQPRLNYGIEIDLDRPSLATPAYVRLRKDATARCTAVTAISPSCRGPTGVTADAPEPPEFRHPFPKPWRTTSHRAVFPPESCEARRLAATSLPRAWNAVCSTAAHSRRIAGILVPSTPGTPPGWRPGCLDARSVRAAVASVKTIR